MTNEQIVSGHLFICHLEWTMIWFEILLWFVFVLSVGVERGADRCRIGARIVVVASGHANRARRARADFRRVFDGGRNDQRGVACRCGGRARKRDVEWRR